jgi:hypothetical protein
MRYLRQLLLFCYKAYVTHDTKTVNEAFSGFVQTNAEVGKFSDSLARESPRLLDSVRRHVQSVLYGFREKGIIPSHGPGAVTTSKRKWKHLYSSIEYLYPFSDWFALFYNADHAAQLEDAEFLDIIEAKLIAVPKDSRGPRLICVHPAEAIWIQQGLRRELERVISQFRYHPGPWPRGRVTFDDQTVNGKIALISSKSRKYATIDMKEASDRIAEPLVQILFGRHYKWFGCCRAQKYRIPEAFGLTNVKGHLNCYAPMGNATTFPVQSLVFWSICVASMQRRGFHQPGAAFVFGDDIVVPSEVVEPLIEDLESFGLRVNRTKSFWRSAFRESCGVDAFNGINVTPVRWKLSLDADTMSELQSLSDLGQRLRCSGYESAASHVYATLRSKLKQNYGGKDLFFTNNPNHGGLAEYTPSTYLAFRDAYWRRDVQWFVDPVWRLKYQDLQVPDSDWNHVLESVCSLERTAHGEIATRPVSRRARLDRGWTIVA